MKKLIFSALLLMGGVAFVNAQGMIEPQTAPTKQSSNEGSYTTVALDTLNAVVQEAIKTLAGDTSEFKTVEFNDAKKQTRVTLMNKADKSDKCIVLDNEGKEVTQAAATLTPAAKE